MEFRVIFLALDARLALAPILPYYEARNVGRDSDVEPISNQWKPYLLLINNVPTSELANIRVGFDLMGAGSVWVDDVHVYDSWFPQHEQDDLMIMRGLAARSLSMGQITDCRQILRGYWSQFLLQHIPVDTARVAELPASSPGSDAASFPPPQSNPEEKEASMIDKVKKLPSKVFPFRFR